MHIMVTAHSSKGLGVWMLEWTHKLTMSWHNIQGVGRAKKGSCMQSADAKRSQEFKVQKVCCSLAPNRWIHFLSTVQRWPIGAVGFTDDLWISQADPAQPRARVSPVVPIMNCWNERHRLVLSCHICFTLFHGSLPLISSWNIMDVFFGLSTSVWPRALASFLSWRLRAWNRLKQNAQLKSQVKSLFNSWVCFKYTIYVQLLHPGFSLYMLYPFISFYINLYQFTSISTIDFQSWQIMAAFNLPSQTRAAGRPVEKAAQRLRSPQRGVKNISKYHIGFFSWLIHLHTKFQRQLQIDFPLKTYQNYILKTTGIFMDIPIVTYIIQYHP